MLSLIFIPILACIALVLIHVYFGGKVLARGILFIDLAIAQWAGLGYLLAHYWQISNSVLMFLISFLLTLIPALTLSLIKPMQSQTGYQEAVIGVLYVLAAALATVLVSVTGIEYAHLENMLIGHLLFITPLEWLSAVAIYAAVGLFYWVFRNPIRDSNSVISDLIFYTTFGLVVTSSVKLAGILSVFGFLVLPPLTVCVFVKKSRPQLLWGWGVGIVGAVLGLGVSIATDIPPGIAVILVLSGIWVLSLPGVYLWRKANKRDVNGLIQVLRC